MEKIIHDLIRIIDEGKIEGEEKARLYDITEALKKEKEKNDFKQNRFAKDKTIAVNLLNATIEDLEKKKKIIEENNDKLVEHRKMIEHKNNVLEMQKKRIEDQSKRIEENFGQLEESYRELEQFTYIASHDLKSPLRTITNFGQLLKKRIGSNLDEESTEFLDFIINGAKQMNKVICDLLEFAHIGNKNKVESLFDITDVMDIVKFNLAEPIKEKKVDILFEKLPKIYGLRSGVIQLFQNLIGNAIKFKKEDQAPVIHITFEEREEEFYFEVQDNGVGMDEAYQEKAFMPFQRINNLERPGSGIGLAICKKVVNQHGGRIWYHSKQGEGTTFCFTLGKNFLKRKKDYPESIIATRETATI